MKKKVCPICDLEMKYPHYCSICRSWVKEPHIMEVNYYLNKPHPKDETDCSYHNDTKQTPARRSASPAGRQPVKVQPDGNEYTSWKPVTPSVKSAGNQEKSGAGDERKRPKSSMRWVLWIFLFIYIILPIFSSLINKIIVFFRYMI